MPAEVPTPILLLLHEGGWDEVAMVAVGLAVAYLVIMWTGRRARDEDEDEVLDEDDDGLPERPPTLQDDLKRPKS